MSEQQKASSSWDPILADCLPLSVSCYNIPLIKFKVTLEVSTPKVKKNRNLHHS